MNYEDLYRDRVRTTQYNDAQSVSAFTFFNKTTETGKSYVPIGDHENLTIIINGHADSVDIKFYETDPMGNLMPFMGLRRSDATAASGTTTLNESWQFTIVGGHEFCVEIVGITNGEVTITGRSV